MTRVAAIVQARMGSSRLPGKVMRDLAGEPMLVRQMKRLYRAKLLDDIVIATTTDPSDEEIVTVCNTHGWNYFRGNDRDVLDRYYKAARSFSADIVVRITSDCPLIEPVIVDQVIDVFLNRAPAIDYVTNVLPRRTYPRGLDTEVISIGALECSWREDTNMQWREHVTQYIHHNQDRFRIQGVTNDTDLSFMRWTVDTSEDLQFVSRIFEHFCNDLFSWRDVLVYLDEHPELLDINRHIQQKVVR